MLSVWMVVEWVTVRFYWHVFHFSLELGDLFSAARTQRAGRGLLCVTQVQMWSFERKNGLIPGKLKNKKLESKDFLKFAFLYITKYNEKETVSVV